MRMFVLRSQDNLRLLCASSLTKMGMGMQMAAMVTKADSPYAALQAKPALKKRCSHGTLCGISWRRILLASPHLACALRRAAKGKHNNNWLINSLQVAAKTKLFSFRGKTLINAPLKSRQTTRQQRQKGDKTFHNFNAEGVGDDVGHGHGHRTQTSCRPRAAGAVRRLLGQGVTKTYAITRGGAVPWPGSQHMNMNGM